MSLSIEGLHYQLIKTFHDFISSSSFEAPYFLRNKQKNYADFVASLEKFAKVSQEIQFMSKLFYLKGYTKETIRFFLFYREMVHSLRPYEVREVSFLEEVSLRFDEWPKIIKSLITWNKDFTDKMDAICKGFNELYNENRGKFNKSSNSIKSMDLMLLCIEKLSLYNDEDLNKGMKKNKDSSQMMAYFQKKNMNINYNSRVFLSPSKSIQKEKSIRDLNVSHEINHDPQENFRSLRKMEGKTKRNDEKVSKTTIKEGINNEEIYKKYQSITSEEHNENAVKKKDILIGKNLFQTNISIFIKPPKKYYQHLMRGSSEK